MNYSTSSYFQDIFYSCFQKLGIQNLQLLFNRLTFIVKRVSSIEFQKSGIKYLKNLPYAIVVVFLGFLFCFLLLVITESKSGLRVINIRTGSMAPAIPVASVILTYPQINYKKGDIVTFQEANPKTGIEYSRTFTHRIVGETLTDGEKMFITKGDHNSNPDPGLIGQNQILGKVVLIIPFLGYLGLFLKTLPGFIMIIAVPALIVVFNEFIYLRGVILERN